MRRLDLKPDPTLSNAFRLLFYWVYHCKPVFSCKYEPAGLVPESYLIRLPVLLCDAIIIDLFREDCRNLGVTLANSIKTKESIGITVSFIMLLLIMTVIDIVVLLLAMRIMHWRSVSDSQSIR